MTAVGALDTGLSLSSGMTGLASVDDLHIEEDGSARFKVDAHPASPYVTFDPKLIAHFREHPGEFRRVMQRLKAAGGLYDERTKCPVAQSIVDEELARLQQQAVGSKQRAALGARTHANAASLVTGESLANISSTQEALQLLSRDGPTQKKYMDFMGLHGVSPSQSKSLLEVIQGKKPSDHTILASISPDLPFDPGGPHIDPKFGSLRDLIRRIEGLGRQHREVKGLRVEEGWRMPPDQKDGLERQTDNIQLERGLLDGVRQDRVDAGEDPDDDGGEFVAACEATAREVSSLLQYAIVGSILGVLVAFLAVALGLGRRRAH